MMHHQHTGADIRPGDVLTYQPNPAPGYPQRATVYVLAVAEDQGRAHVRALAFTHSSWPHLYADRIHPHHPVTISRPDWATIGDGIMSHIIRPMPGETVTTWCTATDPQPLEAAHMPRHPLCRTCGYRAAKEYAALAAPFSYHLPGAHAAPQDDQDDQGDQGDQEAPTE